MKPVKELDPAYLYAGEIDAGDRKIAVALNLAGLVLLFIFGWLFIQFAVAIRPEIQSASLFSIFAGTNLLALILGLAGVLLLHELVHGFFFWLFTRERPRFGLHLLYAYAAAPDWYLPRNQYFVVGLAPFICISLAGLLLLALVPMAAVPVLLLALIFNAAGSVGDLAVGGWLLGQPADLAINDVGPSITFYKKVASPVIISMSERWLHLANSLGFDGQRARQTFADLVECYTQKGRYYHNLEHVRDILDTVEELKDLAGDLTAIQLAAWFHDVVYDPQADDNEVQSAQVARRLLTGLGLDPETGNQVSDLILATISHTADEGDIDAQILIDADLAPLAADKARFLSQTEALRQEYIALPDEEYRQNRTHFLSGFLARERIYLTDPMFDALEGKARRNLNWALTELA